MLKQLSGSPNSAQHSAVARNALENFMCQACDYYCSLLFICPYLVHGEMLSLKIVLVLVMTE